MTLDADNWQLLQELFHLAENTPAQDRDRVLCERCADHALRQRAIQIFNASLLDAAIHSKTGLHSLLRHSQVDRRAKS